MQGYIQIKIRFFKVSLYQGEYENKDNGFQRSGSTTFDLNVDLEKEIGDTTASVPLLQKSDIINHSRDMTYKLDMEDINVPG